LGHRRTWGDRMRIHQNKPTQLKKARRTRSMEARTRSTEARTFEGARSTYSKAPCIEELGVIRSHARLAKEHRNRPTSPGEVKAKRAVLVAVLEASVACTSSHSEIPCPQSPGTVAIDDTFLRAAASAAFQLQRSEIGSQCSGRESSE